MKDDLFITVVGNIIVFQSPCGEEVMKVSKVLKKFGFTEIGNVSVPLRGRGNERRRFAIAAPTYWQTGFSPLTGKR